MSMTPPKAYSRSAALTPKYARLLALIEKFAERFERGEARSEVEDLQHRALASIQECADVALSLAETVGDAACPRDITCLHLGDWNHCNACLNEQVGRFFEQAGKFLTAVMLSAEPGPFIAKTARAEPKSCHAFPERAASFTEAQQRVFELLVTGLPNKLIAYEIGVSEATIKAHVSAVLRKLRVRSRAQAIALSSAFERTRSDQPSAY